MLELLRIRQLALIESADLDLGEGFNALTGETGAGKSLVLEAVDLLRGERAQPSTIRKGADRAVVEAILNADGSPAIASWLESHGIEPGEGGSLLLRREVLASGRSRGAINGVLVTMGQLAELGGLLFQVHRQGEHHGLVDPSVQRNLLDRFAGAMEARLVVAAAWDAHAAAVERLAALSREDQAATQRADFLRFQVEEIEKVDPRPGERDLLDAERRRLAHADELRTCAARALESLYDGADGANACDLLGQAQSAVDAMARHDPAFAGLAATLGDAASMLADAARGLSSQSARIEADPDRLAEIEDRLESLRRLERKHGCTGDALVQRLQALRAELDSLGRRDADREDAAREVARLGAALVAAAAKLTTLRSKACPRFARAIVERLEGLCLPGVRFRVDLCPAASPLPGRDGAEDVEFVFSANAGEDLLPLRRVGSGGELSRVTLALHALGGEETAARTMVFDEVDAGLSGRAAEAVGAALRTLGAKCQVLCVTHQAAVAAQADQQFVVRKGLCGDRTVSAVAVVEGDQRREEVARLLDGHAGTASRQLAGEMLSARKARVLAAG